MESSDTVLKSRPANWDNNNNNDWNIIIVTSWSLSTDPPPSKKKKKNNNNNNNQTTSNSDFLVFNHQPTKQRSPFLSAQKVKEFFKLVEQLQPSSFVMPTQYIIWNRNLPHFSPFQTYSLVPSSLRMQGPDLGKMIDMILFSFTSWMFKNSGPF